MKDGTLEIQAPVDAKANRALAFFLRAIATGVFIWLALTAIRWW